jgi:tape measure domain-containing protein
MIHLTAKVDNAEAKRKFKELETSARNSIKGIETESKGMERSMGNLAKGIAAIGGAAAMTGLVKKMVEVRGEFQQLSIAFETMLDSKEKADNLMREAVAFAAKTPFTLTDVASNIKQLMAMGVAVENVMDTMRMLGDVAAGVSVPLSRVAINYGQVLTLGKLQGREVRDFAMAGIPLVDELAKNLGVAKDEVQGLVSAGRVMASDVTQAFRTMSSEGGKFYNLMEKQAKSVTGQIAILKDRIEVMFNEMGTASEGAIYGVIKGAQYLVGHYKDIADILVPLIATFGAYKVALIAVAAAQKAVVSAKSISAFFSLAKSIHSAKDAMLLLNMSMNASTIGLVVAAIAALATTTTILTRRANEAAEAANRAKKAFNEETAGLRSLIEILNDSNLSYEARKDALEKIQEIVPAYHASLTEEGRLINNNTAAIDKYLESLEKEILMKTLYDDLEQAIQKRDNLQDGTFLLSLIGITGGKRAQQRIIDEAVAAVEDIKGKIKTASKGEDASILGPFLPEGFDRELGRIKEAGDLIKQARENVADLNNELSRVKSSPEQYQNAEKWAAAIKEAEENLKNARETLDTLTGGLLGGPVGLIAKTEEVISALNEKKDAATSIFEIAAINDEIAALSKLKESYEALSAVMLEMGRIPLPKVDGSGKVTTPVTTTVPMNGIDIDALTKKYGKQKKEVQEIEKSFMRITDAVYRITSSGLELGVMFGLDPEIARFLDQMVNSILDMKDALSGVSDSASDVAGKMGGIVGGVLSIGVAVADIVKSAWLKDIQDVLDKSENRLNAIERTMKRISDMDGPGDSWFTSDAFSNVQRLIDSLNAGIMGVFDESAKLWAGLINTIDITSKDATEGLTVWQRIWQGILTAGLSEVAHALENMLSDMSNRAASDALKQYTAAFEGIADVFGEAFDITKIDEYKQILQDLEDMDLDADDLYGGQMDDIRKGIENVIEYAEKLKETITAMVGDISGTLYNTVTVEWKKIWQENKEAGADSFAGIAEAAKKNISEIMENIVTQQIWASVMAPVFDSFGTNLTNAIAVGGDITGVFDDFFKGFDANLQDYYGALDKFYTDAESRGWSFGEQDTKLPEDSIKAMREELSKLQEQWENLSASDREGLVGKQLNDDIIALQKEIEAAENLYAEMKEQTELEALQSLLDSAEAKYSLYQKWVQLYGKDTADQMMGDMLADAESYVDELRSGIAGLTAKVTEGTATDEEIRQLEAWEGQLEDIMNQGAQAAINAANEASQAWNDALNEALEGAGTQYEKMAVLQNEYLSALENYEGLDAGPMKDAAKEYLDYLEGMLKDQSTLIENDLRDRYKTQEQANAETLKTFEDDIKYAREVLQDEDLAKEIERQMAEFLSGIAAAGLEATEEWKLIFGDLENISEEAFNNAMAEIRKSVEESVDLTEEAKAEILKNLDAIAAGFKKTLGDAVLEDLKKSFDDLLSYMNDTLSLLDAFGASDALKNVFSGVIKLVEGYKALKIAQEEAALAGSAVDLTKVFSSMTTMILGLVSALKALGSSIIQIIDGSSVSALAGAYDKLTDAIRRSVGEERKRNQEAARQNLINQRNEIARELQKEKSKWGFSFTILGKKIQILGPDQGVVDALTQQLNQIDGALTDLGDTMKDDWLQTDAVSFASELSNILTSQYDSYADMMADVEALTNKTLQNITRQWLTAHFLEDSISQALDALYGGGGEPTAEAYENFRKQVQAASEKFLQESERMSGLLNFGDESSPTSNAGVISKSITENTATWIKGLMMNQNLELNDMNKTMQYISKYSERTANGVEDLTRINSQIAQHTSVLPKMAQGIISLAADVSVIKGKVGISRENL